MRGSSSITPLARLFGEKILTPSGLRVASHADVLELVTRNTTSALEATRIIKWLKIQTAFPAFKLTLELMTSGCKIILDSNNLVVHSV